MFKLVLALIVAVAAAYSSTRLTLENDVTLFQSRNWLRDGPATDADIVQAIFVIKKDENAVKKFEAQVLELSTPSSPSYGKWLTREEIIAQIAPSQDDVKFVVDFLTASGVTDITVSDFRDKIFVKMPAPLAESILSTEFARFRSVTHRDEVITRITRPYSLPEDVTRVVSFVDDILRFPSIRQTLLSYENEGPAFNTSATDVEFTSCGTSCNGFTTPDVLKKAYSYSPVTTATKGNSVAVAEFQNQYYDQADLTSFSNACKVTTTVDNVIGGNKESTCTGIGAQPCVEALLDIEYIGAIVHPIPLTTVYSSTYSLQAWGEKILSLNILVHSVSYGNDEVQQTSTAYMSQVDSIFASAAALGISILFASGDQGVWGRTGYSPKGRMNPDFPAASNWVTAVGGTNFKTKGTIGAESAWNCGGGGFSDYFTRPSWQSTAVSTYLTKYASSLPSSNLYTATGRGYPDVSALGGQTNPYCISYKGGKFSGVAGTSASCPVVAGLIAQLNNQRLAAGKPSLGFLNPWLYSNADCFNDVNDGSQNNCNNGAGFPATAGWDAATGLGTPKYSCLATRI